MHSVDVSGVRIVTDGGMRALLRLVVDNSDKMSDDELRTAVVAAVHIPEEISTAEVCMMTGYSRSTVAGWVRNGTGPKSRLDSRGRRMWNREDVLKWRKPPANRRYGVVRGSTAAVHRMRKKGR